MDSIIGFLFSAEFSLDCFLLHFVQLDRDDDAAETSLDMDFSSVELLVVKEALVEDFLAQGAFLGVVDLLAVVAFTATDVSFLKTEAFWDACETKAELLLDIEGFSDMDVVLLVGIEAFEAT